MIFNQNIVCIANNTWFGDYQKPIIQLLSRLAKNNNVLFIQYPFTIKDLLLGLFAKNNAPIKKILGIQNRIDVIAQHESGKAVTLTLPPVIPFNYFKNEHIFRLILKFNSFIIARSIKKVMKKLHMNEVISITSFMPFYGLHLMGKLNEKLNIYYCYDAINDHRNKERGLKIENHFCTLVDGVITTSDLLCESKLKFNPQTFPVKNGVDFNMFNKMVDLNKPVQNKRKRIGFIGSIDFRFDIELMSYVISHLPNYDFLIVGRNVNQKAIDVISHFSNVTVNAPVQASEVPSVMYSCDLGLIPLTRIPINRNVYPLKINEYLAVGLPIVLTDFAALPEFKNYISIASTKEDFLKCIVYEIENDSKEKKAERIKFAKNNSWEVRTEEFSNAIIKIAETKSNTQPQLKKEERNTNNSKQMN